MSKTDNPTTQRDPIRACLLKFLRAKDPALQKELFDELMDRINEKFGTNPPASITQRLHEHLTERNEGDDLRRLGYYYERIERYPEALEWYTKSHDIDKSYKSLHNLARLSSYMNDLTTSLKHFEDCLKCQIDNRHHLTTITYNYCFTLSLTGDYKKANKVSADLTQLYQAVPENEQNGQYWLDYGDHFLYNLSRPIEAVTIYEKGLRSQEELGEREVEILLGLVNACNKCLALLSVNDNHTMSNYIRKARSYFNRAEKLIKEAPISSNQRLGDLYFYNRNIEEARKCYETILKKNMSTVGDQKGDIFYFLGLCHLYSEKYKEAIKYFDESMHKNQVTYICIHLAQCHLKLGNFQEAEDLFDRIIHEAPNNTNALIGQIFLYMDWADHVKTSNPEKSSNYLDRSIDTATRLLAQNHDASYQRDLTPKEVHELKYAISYCNLEKSKLLKSKQGKILSLEQAKTYLTDLVQQNNNAFYFRSNRTLGELEKILDDFSRNKQGTQRPLMRVGLLTAVLALFMIFIGKPALDIGYQVDTDLLAAQLGLNRHSVDSIFHNKRFSDKKEMATYVDLMYADKIAELDRHVRVKAKKDYFELSIAKIDTEFIIFIMSVSVVFAILAILSNEVKVLKVGVIHIEKSEHLTLMDQIELKMSR